MLMTLLACGGGSSATLEFDGTTYKMKAKRDLEYNNAIEAVYIIYQGDDAELSFDLVGAPQHGGVTTDWFDINLSDDATYEEVGFAAGGARVTQVDWNGGASPWTLSGEIDGEAADGRAIGGTFTMQAPDCSTTIFPLYYCGGLIRSTVHGDSIFFLDSTLAGPAELGEQLWTDEVTQDGVAVAYDGATMTAPSGLVLECEAGRLQETGWGGDYTVLCHADGEPVEIDGCSYDDVDVFGSPHWFLYATAGSTDAECPVQLSQLYGDWASLQGDPPEE